LSETRLLVGFQWAGIDLRDTLQDGLNTPMLVLAVRARLDNSNLISYQTLVLFVMRLVALADADHFAVERVAPGAAHHYHNSLVHLVTYDFTDEAPSLSDGLHRSFLLRRSGNFALAHDSAKTRDLSPHLPKSRRVLQLTGRVLKTQIEQFLIRLVELARDLGL
jgi:hypothetical protein